MKLAYFKLSEFDSPDEPGSGENMKASTLKMLDKLRFKVGFPITITSGYRTEEANEKAGGVNGSSHTKGFAIDCRCWNSRDRFKLVITAAEVGFNRIGVSKRFIHLDNDPDKDQEVLWLY